MALITKEVSMKESHPEFQKRELGYWFLTESFYLCIVWFTVFHPKTVIKRELGENPKQSRCCKFHLMFASILLL